MGATRIDRALTAVVPPIPPEWRHSITPGKPSAPSTAGLTSDELDLFNLWRAKREYGTIEPQLQAQVDSPVWSNVKAMTITYEAYYVGADFVAWSYLDLASRIMQWRLTLVDVASAVDGAGTVPPSFAADGVGVAAPGIGDLTVTS